MLPTMQPDARRLRVAGYVRTSTDEQAKDATHETQITHLRELATARGWDLTLYVEPGVSGETVAARPRLRELLAAAQAGRYDAVAVRAVDRLSRSQRYSEWGQVLDVLRDARLRLIVGGRETDLGSAVERFSTGALGLVAGLERELIRERTEAGRARALAAGRKPRGVDPLGLRHHRDEHRWEIVAHEALVVRRAYALALDGLDTRAVSRRLRDEGHHGRSGRPITPGMVWRALRSRTYVGEWVHRAGTVRVPPIVERETWERVQALLGERRVRGPQRETLLSGLAWCAACSLPCHAADTGRSGTPYLICASAHRHYREQGRVPCRGIWRRDRVDAATWEVAVRLLTDEDYLASVEPTGGEDRAAALAAEITRHERRLRDLDGRVSGVTLRWSHGQLADAAYDVALGTLRGERALSEARLRECRDELATLAARQAVATDDLDYLTTARASLGTLTLHDRRRVLLALCPRRSAHGVWLESPSRLRIRAVVPGANLGRAPASPEGAAGLRICAVTTVEPVRKRRIG